MNCCRSSKCCWSSGMYQLSGKPCQFFWCCVKKWDGDSSWRVSAGQFKVKEWLLGSLFHCFSLFNYLYMLKGLLQQQNVSDHSLAWSIFPYLYTRCPNFSNKGWRSLSVLQYSNYMVCERQKSWLVQVWTIRRLFSPPEIMLNIILSWSDLNCINNMK